MVGLHKKSKTEENIGIETQRLPSGIMRRLWQNKWQIPNKYWSFAVSTASPFVPTDLRTFSSKLMWVLWEMKRITSLSYLTSIASIWTLPWMLFFIRISRQRFPLYRLRTQVLISGSALTSQEWKLQSLYRTLFELRFT